MPVYNAMPYLQEAVTSILRQTYDDFEFLIFDDGSTDGSLELLRTFDDTRVRVFPCEHGGYVPLLNRGLAECNGNYIARMDADDVAEPTRLGKQVAHMESNPNCAACGTDVTIIDCEGEILSNYSPRPKSAAESLMFLALGKSPMIHPTVLVRTSAIQQSGGYEESFCPAEDYALWWKLSLLGAIENIPEKLLKYRKHVGNISHQKRDLQIKNTSAGLIQGLVLHKLANDLKKATMFARVVYPTDSGESLDTRDVARGYSLVSRKLMETFIERKLPRDQLHQAFSQFRWRLDEFLNRNGSTNHFLNRLQRFISLLPNGRGRLRFVVSHLFWLVKPKATRRFKDTSRLRV